MNEWYHVTVTAGLTFVVFAAMLWVGTVPLGIDDPAGDLWWIALSGVVAGYASYRVARWNLAQDQLVRDRTDQTN